jgi:hypothetical protein
MRSPGSLRLLGTLSPPPRELLISEPQSDWRFRGEWTGVLHKLRSFSMSSLFTRVPRRCVLRSLHPRSCMAPGLCDMHPLVRGVSRAN